MAKDLFSIAFVDVYCAEIPLSILPVTPRTWKIWAYLNDRKIRRQIDR